MIVARDERRFRASVYIDVWVSRTDDLEADRIAAHRIADEFAGLRPNSYVGGVAAYGQGEISKALDREI